MKVWRVSYDNEAEVGYAFRCPGCGHVHVFYTKRPSGPKWRFNGNVDKPTFTPSLKQWANDTDGKLIYRCHFIVTDGRIHFCNDCTHAPKDKEMELSDITEPPYLQWKDMKQ